MNFAGTTTSFFRSPTRVTKVDDRFLQSSEGAGLRQAAAATQEAAQTLGEIALLVQHIPEIGDLPLPQALERLERPGKLQQRRLYRDAEGQLCGYVAWAWLDADLAYQGVPSPQALAPHQWNEGPHLLVCDAYATASGLARVCADLSNGLYPGVPMHLRPAAADGDGVQAAPIDAQDFDGLHNTPDMDAPVIDILALLRARVHQQSAERA